MFGLFKSRDDDMEESRESAPRRTLASLGRCKTYHREIPQGDRGVYVEVREEGDCKIYISSYGVTPAYTHLPYDKWCRDALIESYVFANVDSAKMYFKDRKSDMVHMLAQATSPYQL